MKRILHLTILCLLLSGGIHAQVTIGSGQKPNTGALLDLKTETDGTSKLGLGMPRVELSNLKPTTAADLAKSIGNATGSYDMAAHIGLIVYNVKERTTEAGACPGLHVWDGAAWHPIVAYPAVETRKTPVGTPTKVVTLLGSYSAGGIINASDPMWAALGKNPVDYPIGATPSISMTDGDNNTYNSQRFYVGYQTETGTYKTEKMFSCNPSNIVWTDMGTAPETIETFVDGVWITSNVYSTQRATGGAFDKGSVDIDANARLNPAYYSNASGAIPIAVGGLSTSTTVKYGENTTSGSTWNNTVSQKAYASKFGLSYTHHQATQVCPTGWSLPDDTMWKALADAHGGVSTAGAAMRSKPSASGSYFYRSQDNAEYKWGTPASESTTAPSGFAALPSGYVRTDGAFAYGFSNYAYWWSATTSGSSRGMNFYNSGLFAFTNDAGYYFSVRCVKN